MAKPNSKLTLMTLLMMFSVIAFTLYYRSEAEYWIVEAASLRDAVNQASVLKEENQELRERLQEANRYAEKDAKELARLYAQVGGFRQAEQEVMRLKDKGSDLTGQILQAPLKDEWLDRTYGQGTADRGIHCARWAHALLRYASDHDGEFPTSLREAVGYLGDDERALQTALTRDQYEILYYGRRDEMGDPNETLVIREKHPKQTTDGNWTRAYAYGNSSAKFQVSSDGTFGDPENPPSPKLNIRLFTLW